MEVGFEGGGRGFVAFDFAGGLKCFHGAGGADDGIIVQFKREEGEVVGVSSGGVQ